MRGQGADGMRIGEKGGMGKQSAGMGTESHNRAKLYGKDSTRRNCKKPANNC